MNVLRRIHHYATVLFRMCWLLRKWSDERARAPASCRPRDPDVPRIGRYDEISMQDQLAIRVKNVGRYPDRFFYYAYISVPLEHVSRGMAHVYRSHTRSNAGCPGSGIIIWPSCNSEILFVARFCMDFTLPSHFKCPYRCLEGTSMKSGIKSYHYGFTHNLLS
jgi:hypothetical protein